MTAVFQKIIDLNDVSHYSKKERIIEGLIRSIRSGDYVQGDFVPSVNEMSQGLGVAKETVVKAYKELKDRGILTAKHGVGYFISSSEADQKLNIALVLYAFHTFQQIFYDSIREQLGDEVNIDVFFHHNNLSVYENILGDIKGRYGMYIIAPIHHPSTPLYLSNIPKENLLLVDRYEFISEDHAFVSQEFENSTFEVLKSLIEPFSKFNEIVLFYTDDIDYPKQYKTAFERFCQDQKIKGRIEKKYSKGSIKKGTAYITIGDIDLWTLLKDTELLKLELGVDVGILSTNDSPVKEIICGGITTYHADFDSMADKAVQFVKTREVIQEILPVSISRRKSL